MAIDEEKTTGDWREALTSAWDATAEEPAATSPAPPAPEAADKSETTETAPAAVTAPGDEPRPVRHEARQRDGKFAKTTTSSVAPAKTAASAVVAPPQSGGTPAIRPPAGWKPAEREAWAGIPETAKAAIQRRETEIAKALQQVAPERQAAQRFQAIVSPYAGMIQAEGGDPFGTVQNLFQTYAALRTAPAAAKAGLVASIIGTFGIDPGLVAAHLQGKAPPPEQSHGVDSNQLAQQIEQRIERRLQSRRMGALGQSYEQKLADFESSHEFVGDVRETMAKLLESGLASDFEDAYAKSVNMDPVVSGYIKQREEAKQANAAKASTQRARAASTSLKSSAAGPSGGPQSKDLRSVLETIYDERSGARR